MGSPLAEIALALIASIGPQGSGTPLPTPAQVPARAPSPAEADLVAGRKLYLAASYEAAEKCFESALRKEPGEGKAWKLLGLARHAQRKWSEAASAFEKALALSPTDPIAWGNLGACRFELQDLEHSADAFRRVLAADPADSAAHLFLARIAIARGDDSQAEREFAAAAQSPKPDPVAFLHQGLFLFQVRRLEEARRALERALELDPDMPGAHLNLGLVLERTGDEKGARIHLDRFRALSELAVGDRHKRLRANEYLRAANADIEAGRLDAALAIALRALDELPDQPAVHRFLARIYALEGRLQESQDEFARANALTDKAGGR